jgi:peptide/nickel transport system ATP-binding protein
MAALLELDNLTAAYRHNAGWANAIREISFKIELGQSYGVVGESGSGKTTLALAILNYLAGDGRVQGGRVILDGQNLLALKESELRKVWGAKIGWVPQNPLSALNPTLRIGEQISEALIQHFGIDRRLAAERVLGLLRLVRLPDVVRIARSYPHQLSGGMLQRVMIALALGANPRLLILDEPTTNLDVTTQAAILDLFQDLILDAQASVLYISHNLGVIARLCQRALVLYAGEMVEDARLVELFKQPLHPYTRGLLNSLPVPGQNKNQHPLQSIPGSIPALGDRPAGCIFMDRCPLVLEVCRQRPAWMEVTSERWVRCHRWQEIYTGRIKPDFQASGSTKPEAQPVLQPGAQPELLSLRAVGVDFSLGRSLGDFVHRRPERRLAALQQVDLSLSKTLTVGLVGESGSGKTTLARAILGLVEPTRGAIELLQAPLPGRLSSRSLETLRKLQLVFQNPEEALNPHRTIGATLRRPVIRFQNKTRPEADDEVRRLLHMVQLPESTTSRFPGQLSGGEKQRVAIARAFAANPELLVADEPVSALDVSVQASILNLLNLIQVDQGTTILFISHDLTVVGYLADLVAVIYLGQLMEIKSAQDLFTPPYHPYSEALLSAIPALNLNPEREHIRLEGEVPSPINRPVGCPFHTRCPRRIGPICAQQAPPWQSDARGTRIYCHIPLAELQASQHPIIHIPDLPGAEGN